MGHLFLFVQYALYMPLGSGSSILFFWNKTTNVWTQYLFTIEMQNSFLLTTKVV